MILFKTRIAKTTSIRYSTGIEGYMTLCELNFKKMLLEVQCKVCIQFEVLQVCTTENFLILQLCIKMLTTVSNE